jgi:predicted RNA polymerase sigma factor
MVMELCTLIMDLFLSDNSKKVRLKDQDIILWQMVHFIKDGCMIIRRIVKREFFKQKK